MAKFKVGDTVVVKPWSKLCEIRVVHEKTTAGQAYTYIKEGECIEHTALEQAISPVVAISATKPWEDTSVLIEAESLVHGDRAKAYGNPLDNNERIARLWSVIAGAPISAHHVPLMMIALKISRQTFNPKRDNLVDIAGYAETAQLMVETERNRINCGSNDCDLPEMLKRQAD